MPNGIQLAASLRIATRPFNDIERMVIERANDPEDHVVMHINPQRISIRHRKVIQRVQTNTRWVFQHWGAEPVTLTYSGVTGYMNPKLAQDIMQRYMLDQIADFRWGRGLAQEKLVSPYTTPAYRALLKLKEFYEEPHKELQGTDLTSVSGNLTDVRLQKLKLNLYYRDTMYIGYFTRMEIQEEENSPWMWSYSMEYTAYDTQTSRWKGLVTKWERDELGKAAIEAGVDPDLLLHRGAAETASSITQGTRSPATALREASLTAWQNPSFKRSPGLTENLLARNRVTSQSSSEEVD